MRSLDTQHVQRIKYAIFLIALIPFGRLLYGVFVDPELLGANPAETITRSTGDWTLRFLLITLAVTPLRRMLDWNWLIKLRRMLGLFAYFYVLLHLSSYVAFDHVFDVGEILRDIVKRPFITVGMTAFLLLTPLALTSTNAMVRRLGGKRWQALHRLIYIIAPLGVLHFWWMVKRDIREPLLYAVILAVLLGYRLFHARRNRPIAARIKSDLRPSSAGPKA